MVAGGWRLVSSSLPCRRLAQWPVTVAGSACGRMDHVLLRSADICVTLVVQQLPERGLWSWLTLGYSCWRLVGDATLAGALFASVARALQSRPTPCVGLQRFGC